ncbi:MAG: exo-alpha-sialidase [Bacteroidaceae bacterium]|nr:exo-alpha-sialidase [Bacteroidaceae bacterium]
MKKNFLLLSLLSLSLATSAQTDVFRTRTLDDIPYRIPAIATAKDGTLVAVSDYRYCHFDIGAGRIDLHFRRSADNGRTWGNIYQPPTMMGDGDLTPGHQEAGYGDAAIAVDRKSGRMMLISCSGGPLFGQSTVERHQGMARFYSDDGGLTWSRPDYIGEDVIYKPLAQGKYGPIKAWFVGSGRIFQSRTVKVGKYYRLYCAGVSRNDKENANWVIYSDDFGLTWGILGGTDASPVPGGDEPKCEELPDGRVLLSSRAWGGRFYNIFTFTDVRTAQGQWGEKAFSGKDNQGVEAVQNSCNGEVVLLPVVRTSDKRKTYLLLQSLPFGPGRANVGIYYKELSTPEDYATPQALAANWTGRYQVSSLPSAYSTMAWQHDGTLGFFYEEETHCNSSKGGYNMVYRNLTLETITEGKYKAGK